MKSSGAIGARTLAGGFLGGCLGQVVIFLLACLALVPSVPIHWALVVSGALACAIPPVIVYRIPPAQRRASELPALVIVILWCLITAVGVASVWGIGWRIAAS